MRKNLRVCACVHQCVRVKIVAVVRGICAGGEKGQKDRNTGSGSEMEGTKERDERSKSIIKRSCAKRESETGVGSDGVGRGGGLNNTFILH